MAIEVAGDKAMPRIAVVVPVYNAAATLGKALDSILTQTYPAHEIIVVDDGSTDQTAELVKAYTGQVNYIRQENAGPSAARNRGVQEASAEWIAFLDADDWYLPERLRAHAEMIREQPDLDFLVGGYDFVKPDGEVINSSIAGTDLGRQLLDHYGPQGRAVIEGADIGRFIANQFSDTRSLTLPRTTFLELGGFPLDQRIGEDLMFMLRLCAQSQCIGVACQSLSVYAVHDAGLIRSDLLHAQQETIRALHTLESEMSVAPAPVYQAWRQLLKGAYRNLALHRVRSGRRGAALRSALDGFRFSPTWSDVRFMLSLLRG